jgi:hypothetical protein
MPADAERIVQLVEHYAGVEVRAGSPRVSAELPETRERFEGLLPPVVAAPCFAIRRGTAQGRIGPAPVRHPRPSVHFGSAGRKGMTD